MVVSISCDSPLYGRALRGVLGLALVIGTLHYTFGTQRHGPVSTRYQYPISMKSQLCAA